MPSHLHEALIEMFRGRPELAAELLSSLLDVDVPRFESAHLSPGELNDVTPTEYRADAVVTMTIADLPVLAVVVEVQLRPHSRKRQTWPAYVANLHARLGCSVYLLVLCADPATATWCAEPIVVSRPGLVLTPLVLGPAQVPVVTDAALARNNPELAVLSALAHGSPSGPIGLFEALLAALDVVDQDHANLYADVVLAALPKAAQEILEALMTTTAYEYQSDFARRYFSQGEATGEAKGEAKGVLAVLDARGIAVTADVRDKILGCTDLAQLDTWIRRAITIGKIDELFD